MFSVNVKTFNVVTVLMGKLMPEKMGSRRSGKRPSAKVVRTYKDLNKCVCFEKKRSVDNTNIIIKVSLPNRKSTWSPRLRLTMFYRRRCQCLPCESLAACGRSSLNYSARSSTVIWTLYTSMYEHWHGATSFCMHSGALSLSSSTPVSLRQAWINLHTAMVIPGFRKAPVNLRWIGSWNGCRHSARSTNRPPNANTQLPDT